MLEEARELFWEAHSHFEKGQYVEALRLFEQTYALRQEPEVLFNLALTHQRLGHCEQARALYQEYQARVRADVTKQLGELEQRCPTSVPPAEVVPAPLSLTVVKPPPPPAAASPPAAAPPLVPDTATPEPFPLRTVGWVAIGASAVALGAAVYFESERRQYRSDFEDLADDPSDPSQPGNAGDQLEELEADHDRARTLAVTMSVVSGVLAVGGVTLLVVAPNTPAHAAAEPGRGLGLGLRWAGSF